MASFHTWLPMLYNGTNPKSTVKLLFSSSAPLMSLSLSSASSPSASGSISLVSVIVSLATLPAANIALPFSTPLSSTLTSLSGSIGLSASSLGPLLRSVTPLPVLLACPSSGPPISKLLAGNSMI